MVKDILKKASVLCILTATVTILNCNASITASEQSQGAVTAVTLNITEMTLIKVYVPTGKLTAEVFPKNASDTAVIWDSSRPDIAAVDQKGTVTAKKGGVTVITAINKASGQKAACTVTVFDYRITYVVNGGDENHGNPVAYNQETAPIQLKPTAKSGYLFVGWYSNADFSGDAVTEIISGSSGNLVLYAQFTPQQKTYRAGDVTFTMISIPAAAKTILGKDTLYEKGTYEVSLNVYALGETEVTQDLWQTVMQHNPSSYMNNPNSGEKQEKHPVENVTWYECIVFCNELTKQVGLSEADCVYMIGGQPYSTQDAVLKKIPAIDIKKKGFRLPTEAEWEWAAKGGSNFEYAGTSDPADLNLYAWYGKNSGNIPHEVKKKRPNGYGLYDMTGNVWECCWNRYKRAAPAGGHNPLDPDSGERRSRRGGCYSSLADTCFCAFRDHFLPHDRWSQMGLRVAMSI